MDTKKELHDFIVKLHEAGISALLIATDGNKNYCEMCGDGDDISIAISNLSDIDRVFYEIIQDGYLGCES